jgi:MFS family permease
MVVFALFVCAYLDRFVIAMIAPSVKASLKLTDFQLGIILGPAFAVSYAVFGIPLGRLADRRSRRMVIFVGAMIFASATALSGWANSFLTLLIGWIFVGIGESSLSPAALSLLAEKFPRERLTTAVAIFSMGPKLGQVAAFSLGGFAITAATALVGTHPALQSIDAWRIVLAATALPSLMIGFLALTFTEPSRQAMPSDAPDDRSAMGFLRDERRLIIPMLFGFSFILICGQSLISWVPSYIDREFHMTPSLYGPILSAISLAGALTLVFKGLIMDWFFARGVKDIHLRFYSWLLLATLPLAVAVFLVKNIALFFVCYAIVGVVTIPSIAYASVAMQIVTPPKLRAQTFAIFSVPLLVIGGLGPPLVGALTDYVFHDEARLGWSLAVIMCTTIPGCLICLRLALPGLRSAVAAAEGVGANGPNPVG